MGMILLSITDKNLFVKYGNHKLSTNLIDGQFPNYQRVIPQSQQNRVTLQKEPFEKAIRRVSLLVEHKSRCIYLKFQPNNLIISSEDSEIGMAREEIECEYSGPDNTITLNYIYLLEPLSEIKEEKLSIEFTDNNKAITIKSIPERNFIHIVMPMQAK